MDLSERGDATRGRHPWEQARQAVVAELLRRHQLDPPTGRPGAQRRWLDAGAGDGWIAGHLADVLGPGWTVDAVDPNYRDADLEDSGPVRRHRNVPDMEYEAMSALDVIEHVPDDVGTLGTWIRHIRPGGLVLVTVPAYQALFSDHDRALGHHRRYRPRQLRCVLESAGLEIVERGAFFTSLLLPRLAARLLSALRPSRRTGNPSVTEHGVGHWRGGPLTTAILAAALRADARLGLALARHGIRIPGLSLFAVARVPNGGPSDG